TNTETPPVISNVSFNTTNANTDQLVSTRQDLINRRDNLKKLGERDRLLAARELPNNFTETLTNTIALFDQAIAELDKTFPENGRRLKSARDLSELESSVEKASKKMIAGASASLAAAVTVIATAALAGQSKRIIRHRPSSSSHSVDTRTVCQKTLPVLSALTAISGIGDEVGLFLNAELSGVDEYLIPFAAAAVASLLIVWNKMNSYHDNPEIETNHPIRYPIVLFVADTVPALGASLLADQLTGKNNLDLAVSFVLVNFVAALLECEPVADQVAKVVEGVKAALAYTLSPGEREAGALEPAVDRPAVDRPAVDAEDAGAGGAEPPLPPPEEDPQPEASSRAAVSSPGEISTATPPSLLERTSEEFPVEALSLRGLGEAEATSFSLLMNYLCSTCSASESGDAGAASSTEIRLPAQARSATRLSM
ncbi:hypothetical protein N9L24_02980, partial [Candidatus Marinamargulisbacteria bacterium]|nr:hypothetical protein [Candidatus Marinamargulisbacteria bacterium]